MTNLILKHHHPTSTVQKTSIIVSLLQVFVTDSLWQNFLLALISTVYWYYGLQSADDSQQCYKVLYNECIEWKVKPPDTGNNLENHVFREQIKEMLLFTIIK